MEIKVDYWFALNNRVIRKDFYRTYNWAFPLNDIRQDIEYLVLTRIMLCLIRTYGQYTGMKKFNSIISENKYGYEYKIAE